MNFNMNNIRHLISTEKSNWVEEAKYRIANKDWLNKTRRFALKILSQLRYKKISKEELSELSGIELDKINLILKGNYDITISEIVKIEKSLNIKLIKQTKI